MRRKCPNLLEFTSYIFCFHGLMCGPFCFYKDYQAYICGTNYPSAVTRTTAKILYPVASKVVVQKNNTMEINGIDPVMGIITENLTTHLDDYSNHGHNHVNCRESNHMNNHVCMILL